MFSSAGVLYTGLPEFEDMSFVLHLLRKNDVMIDIGVNIGVYMILAGRGLVPIALLLSQFQKHLNA